MSERFVAWTCTVAGLVLVVADRLLLVPAGPRTYNPEGLTGLTVLGSLGLTAGGLLWLGLLVRRLATRPR